MPPCRVYIFLNPYHVDETTRTGIAKTVAGKTAIFFYGSGFLNKTAGDDLVSQLIGMPVSRIDAENAEVRFVKGGYPLLRGLSDAPFGSRAKLSPLWAVDADETIVPLATLPGNEALVAAKSDSQGLRVYIGTTDIPAAFLRNVLKASSVHIYVDSDDVVSADEGFLAVTATEAGTKRLTLPERATVRDLHSGRVVAKDSVSIDVAMTLGETRLFVLEDGR